MFFSARRSLKNTIYLSLLFPVIAIGSEGDKACTSPECWKFGCLSAISKLSVAENTSEITFREEKGWFSTTGWIDTKPSNLIDGNSRITKVSVRLPAYAFQKKEHDLKWKEFGVDINDSTRVIHFGNSSWKLATPLITTVSSKGSDYRAVSFMPMDPISKKGGGYIYFLNKYDNTGNSVEIQMETDPKNNLLGYRTYKHSGTGFGVERTEGLNAKSLPSTAKGYKSLTELTLPFSLFYIKKQVSNAKTYASLGSMGETNYILNNGNAMLALNNQDSRFSDLAKYERNALNAINTALGNLEKGDRRKKEVTIDDWKEILPAILRYFPLN